MGDKKVVDLQAYVALKRRDFSKFEEYYSSRAIRDPENYPTSGLSYDQWDDQFEAWDRHVNAKGE